ncbi:endolytic transglycosylase MltG [candidate division KSB1 bacterium]|nr:endolytic transglycosylase MltG [candidate division KSB1 bacterium]
MKRKKRTLLIILISPLLLALLLGGLAVYILYLPLSPRKDARQVDIIVRWGASLGQVAIELEKESVIRNIDQFKLVAELYKKTERLRVGKFTLREGMSNYAALMALVEGPQSYIQFTLPDGYDSRRFARIIEHHLEIDSAEIVNLVSDSAFIAGLGLATTSLEGYLFPETYSFTYGVTAPHVLTTLVEQFNRAVDDSLIMRAAEKGWSLNDALTLASIIEGEAIVDVEMPIISSVYHNRLRIGMPLQADPTIQYIIPDGPRRLLYRDLDIDSPYNTYKYKGLPPAPINNPGRNAIRAALFPAETLYLYFVANGDGTHSFSENYEQHLRAKQRFDAYRRQVREDQQKARNGQ